jgi:hypothetical protein
MDKPWKCSSNISMHSISRTEKILGAFNDSWGCRYDSKQPSSCKIPEFCSVTWSFRAICQLSQCVRVVLEATFSHILKKFSTLQNSTLGSRIQKSLLLIPFLQKTGQIDNLLFYFLKSRFNIIILSKLRFWSGHPSSGIPPKVLVGAIPLCFSILIKYFR